MGLREPESLNDREAAGECYDLIVTLPPEFGSISKSICVQPRPLCGSQRKAPSISPRQTHAMARSASHCPCKSSHVHGQRASVSWLGPTSWQLGLTF